MTNMPQNIRTQEEPLPASTSHTGIAGLPGVFALGFVLSYLKGFLSALATVDIPSYVDDLLLFAGLFFLLLHLMGNARLLGKRLWACLAILILMAACYLLSSDSSPFFACLLFFCVVSLPDIRPLMRFWFCLTCGLVVFNALIYGVQLLTGSAEILYRFGEGGRTARFGLGFVHPNMAGAFLFWLCGCGLFLRCGKHSFVDYIVVEAIAAFVIVVVDSKTSGYLTAALPVVYWMQNQWRIFTRTKAARILVGALPIALFLLTYCLAGPFYNSDIGELFTGRPWLWHTCLVNQGVTFFGQKFESAQAVGYGGFTWDATTLDSFYASGLMVSGILFSALFCAAFFKRSQHNDDLLEAGMPFLCLALLFGFTEGHLLDICFGFPLILLCGSCFSQQGGGCKFEGD